MKTSGARLCVLVAALSFAGIGEAGASNDSGLPLGTLVVQPSIEVGIVYDSNVYRISENPQGDLGAEIKPVLRLVHDGDRLFWDFRAHYRFFSYFDVGLTDPATHSDLRVVTEFGVGTSFDINRRGKVGFFIGPQFFNRPAPRGFVDSGNSDLQLGIELPVALKFRPSDAFEFQIPVRYRWTRAYTPLGAIFNPDPVVLGNRHEVEGGFDLNWKFFPRSRLAVDGGFGRLIWADIEGAGAAPQAPGWFWRIFAGLKGDITAKLSFLAQIGYGGIYFDAGHEADNLTGLEGLLGRAEFAIRPVVTQRIAFGFDRDYEFRYFTNRIVDTQAYVKYRGLFFQRLALMADFSWVLRDLKGDTSGNITRTEHQWTVGVAAEVMLLEWIHVGVDYRFSAVNPSIADGIYDSTGEYIDNRVVIKGIFGFR